MKYLLVLFICPYLCVWSTKANNDNLGISLKILNKGGDPRHSEAKKQFIQNPDQKPGPGSERPVERLMNLHYYDFLNAKNDAEYRNARLEMAVTVHIYLLSQWIPSNSEHRKDFSIEFYNQRGLCRLLNVRIENGLKERGIWEWATIDCGKETEENVQKLLDSNESSIQEAIFQVLKANFIMPKEGNSKFIVRHEKMIKNEKDEEKRKFLQTKFEHLFGRPRLYILLDLNHELFNPFFSENNEIECFMDYFKADNIVDQWRYIYVLNFYVYKNWFEKKQHLFVEDDSTIIRFIFDEKNYWNEENYLRGNLYVGKGKIDDMAGLMTKTFVPNLTGVMFQATELANIFLNTVLYAEKELAKIPSFLEELKQCAENQKGKIPTAAFIKKCMGTQFLNRNHKMVLKKNLDGQKQMRKDALVDILKGNDERQNVVHVNFCN